MTKILLIDGLGANHFIRQALYNALRLHPDYLVYFWDESGKSSFDVFRELDPDLDIFIGSTWQLTRGIVKNLIKRPNVKIVLFADMWGSIQTELDLVKYPVGVTTQEQKLLCEQLQRECPLFKYVITQHNESWKERTHGLWKNIGLEPVSLMCCADVSQYYLTDPPLEYKIDYVYTGSNWEFKSKYLNKFIIPLTYPNTKLKGKIFGGGGWSTPNFCGRANENTIRNYYASSKFIPSIFEPHAIEVYSDLCQRIFQVPACGGFQLSQNAIGLDEVFNKNEICTFDSFEDYIGKINYYLEDNTRSANYRIEGCKRVYKEHTNFSRAAQLMGLFDMDVSWFYQQVGINYENMVKFESSLDGSL